MHNLVGDKLKELLAKADKSAAELGYQTKIHPSLWSRLINGTIRLNVDMAIRLGKVFPSVLGPDINGVTEEKNSSDYWLYYQYQSDLLNAQELDGPMYRDIKPFE